MATPADQRLLELCDKWLKSLELHIRYSGLDTESYWKVQPWPEHQRPSRWIIDLAVQKAVALRSQVQERIKQGDTRFSDSLELMTFLANLIGSEHIERFIPLADPENEADLRAPAPEEAAAPSPARTAPSPARTAPSLERTAPSPARTAPSLERTAPSPARAAPSPAAEATPSRPQPSEAPRTASPARPAPVRAPPAPAAPVPPARAEPPQPAPPPRREAPPKAAQPSDSVSATATREMPQFVPPKRRAPPVGTSHVARTERRSAQTKPAAPRPTGKQPGKLEVSEQAARDQVIADAARLVQWGRKWYELAELIARMADRPALPEVRKILKDNKTAIEKKAAAG
jgi:hypothetical protein